MDSNGAEEKLPFFSLAVWVSLFQRLNACKSGTWGGNGCPQFRGAGVLIEGSVHIIHDIRTYYLCVQHLLHCRCVSLCFAVDLSIVTGGATSELHYPNCNSCSRTPQVSVDPRLDQTAVSDISFLSVCTYIRIHCIYSGTSLLRTPMGQKKVSFIERCRVEIYMRFG